MDSFDLIASFGGVALGWLLHELSSRFAFNRERRGNTDRLRVDAYAQWAAGMESVVAGGGASADLAVHEKRLLLLEQSPDGRRLIKAVWESIPIPDTEEHQELEAERHFSRDFDWSPFRERMDELFEHVRQSLR